MIFAPNVPQELTPRRIQNYLVSWPVLAYSVSIWFILLPKSEKKCVLGLFAVLQISGRKTAPEDKLCDFHRRESKCLGHHTSPQAENMLNQTTSSELHARGKSELCRINENGKILFLVGSRENLNIGTAIYMFMPHCLHVHPSYSAFLECDGLVLLSGYVCSWSCFFLSYLSVLFACR